MREIKFRAWSKFRKEMFDVAVYYLEDGTVSNNPPGGSPGWLYEPKEVEVMQYTGLKDKNGKEIYEGDVVKASMYKDTFQVVFDRGAFMLSRDGKTLVAPLMYADEKFGEVIGNIYENPELLKP